MRGKRRPRLGKGCNQVGCTQDLLVDFTRHASATVRRGLAERRVAGEQTLINLRASRTIKHPSTKENIIQSFINIMPRLTHSIMEGYRGYHRILYFYLFKLDSARTITKHSSLSPYTRHLRLEFSSFEYKATISKWQLKLYW